ncbi:hypothetical protein C8J56DRAFT_777785 [Mycena floridula]|nr:hypothetical protein C8J56DRAFT_777785 [Mycena floridula]
MSSTIRPRRFLLLLLACVGIVLLFKSPSIPEALRNKSLTRANIVGLSKAAAEPVDEIYGLLHLVIADNQRLIHDDPTKPIELTVYGKPVDWHAEVNQLNEKYPIVVFSKVHLYFSYSKKAKDLLQNLDLTPPPKIIEVDLREDSQHIKAILTRLTQHSTFPNIIVQGKSIGGSDNLIALASDRPSFRKMLKAAGVEVSVER